MSDLSASESRNFFDNDDDSIVADSLTPSDIESPRPRKRRRLADETSAEFVRRRPNHDQGSINSGEENAIASSDLNISDDDDDDDDCSLPSPPCGSAEGNAEREKASRYKIFVPKRKNVQENVFVTQLTQPPSSPERIRGPRWKKPDPEQVHRSNTASKTPSEVNCHLRQGNNGYDEDELRAAIAASLDSLEAESTRPASASHMSSYQATAPACLSGPAEGASAILYDLDDIPEDAFDSSPALTPPPRPANPPAPLPQGSNNASRSAMRQPALRQTTLFDVGARNSSSTLHTDDVDASPRDKEEPPTHHKLIADAINTWVYPTNLGKIRDYQFNIAQKGLFHNLLVALPTGLGKTFIAATIMLNWYRWTKDSQIVFVAPTKPLVAQQISACFGIAGIPRSQTTMLTGGAAPGIRAEEWQVKRVFFMTPQTLINDLKTGIADPKRIVLLVVDEAHRATGGYAYVEVVKFLRRFNKSFRVLALTATPGSTVESVQAVIDGLDIARVEIRTEQSLDIREYVHSRNIEIETFENSDEMVECMDQFSSTLQPLVDQLRTLNAYWGRDPMALTAYGLTKARQQWTMSDAGRNANFGLKGKVNAIFSVLASLAHAIDLLKYHGITPFYRHLLHFQSGSGDGQKGGKYQRQIVQDDNFKKMMGRLQVWTKHPEFIGHPKLEYLKQVVLNHFMDRGEGTSADDGSAESKTRIMVFVHFRDSAEEVVRVLKRYEPMIRPHVFIGQSSAKGSEGMDQKTQLNIVEQFKKGTYNTIVATSIGEEGLDIGEVDLIVCYDSSASPIRMLQRMGRTGRKRTGNIVLLLMKGKEEDSYTKAKDNYEKMQQMIASGSRFTFHDDRSPRILPRSIKPVVDKRNIDIPPENSQQDLPEPRRRGRAPKRPPKKFHMPDDVETGFRKASNLSATAAGKSAESGRARRPLRLPTPEPVEVPELEDVLLTPAQQRELQIRYQNVSGTTPQFIRHPRNDAFPSLQSVSRPTRLVKHGSLTRRMIDTLQRMGKTDAGCEDRYQRVLAAEPRSPKTSTSRTRSDEVPIGDMPLTGESDVGRSDSVMSDFSMLDERTNPDPIVADESPLVSPAKLAAMYMGREGGKPPLSEGQAGAIDDTGLDLDLPDLETLLGSRFIQPPARKRRRAVIEDDSDE